MLLLAEKRSNLRSMGMPQSHCSLNEVGLQVLANVVGMLQAKKKAHHGTEAAEAGDKPPDSEREEAEPQQQQAEAAAPDIAVD